MMSTMFPLFRVSRGIIRLLPLEQTPSLLLYSRVTPVIRETPLEVLPTLPTRGRPSSLRVALGVTPRLAWEGMPHTTIGTFLVLVTVAKRVIRLVRAAPPQQGAITSRVLVLYLVDPVVSV